MSILSKASKDENPYQNTQGVPATIETRSHSQLHQGPSLHTVCSQQAQLNHKRSTHTADTGDNPGAPGSGDLHSWAT